VAGLAVDALLLPLLAIVAGAALLRALATRLGQPPVFGEFILGLLLGPTVLGHLWPQAHDAILTGEARTVVEVTGWLGLVFFMYVAGAETRWVAAEPRTTALVAAGGLLVPFALGLALALAQPGWFLSGTARSGGTIVVAVVMAVSALPVLARLLADVGLARAPLGAVVLGAGTIDDVVGWMVLALAVAPGSVGLTGNLALNSLLLATLLAAALLLDRGITVWLRRHREIGSPTHFVVLVIAILGAAFLTHLAGLHAFLGPFAVGALVSRHEPLRRYAHERLQGMTSVLLLPAFFVLVGADVDLALLARREAALALVACFLVASLGKLVGCYVGGRAAGMRTPAALAAGLLLNARGAVGLVVAKVGHDVGLLHDAGYAILVLVILLTTLLAPPTLALYVRWLAREKPARPTPHA